MTENRADVTVDRRITASLPEEKLLRLDEVLSICGKSRSSVYEAIKEGKFPAPIKLQGRSSAWVKSEIQQWVQTCIAASRAN